MRLDDAGYQCGGEDVRIFIVWQHPGLSTEIAVLLHRRPHSVLACPTSSSTIRTASLGRVVGRSFGGCIGISNRLTALKVAKLAKPGRYGDGGGLVLQVSKWRTKAWLFRFRARRTRAPDGARIVFDDLPRRSAPKSYGSTEAAA